MIIELLIGVESRQLISLNKSTIMINDFMNNAKGLTRNPLGIIALFVSLIYGFACLVLSTSIANLNNDSERLPLIWFIIVFPLVILVAFIYLVVNHHEKLYAPGDFRGDDSFIQTIDENKRKLKIRQEVENLESSPISDEQADTNESPENNTEKIVDSSPELLKKDVPIQNSETPTEEELIEIYSNSEKWATDELSIKYNVSFRSNIKLQTQSATFELDAYGRKDKTTYIAEVKFWQSKRSNKRLKLSIQDFLSKKVSFQHAFKQKDSNLKIIIAVVYDNLKNIDKNDLASFISEIGNEDVILELFDYNDLKISYE